MLAQESSSGQQPGAWKASDGRLWFGTIHGIVVVDPKAVLRGERPPPGLIESVTADGKEHTSLAGLVFPPGVRSVEIRYTSMALRGAGQAAFRRRLLGLNAEWTDAGDQRVAVYVNLAPGEYVFEVSARGGDGVWNSAPARVSFSLRPYFYQTRWFIGLCLLAAGLIAVAAYRYRLARMRAEFAAVLGERNRIARELHDTLMQGVAGISVHLEAISALLTTAPEKAADRLERLRGLARRVVEDSRRRIWDLRSSDASGANLIASIGAAARQRTGPAGIHFEMDVSGEPVPLPGKTDDGLLAIAQEAVANAVKHSGSASIRVSLHYGASAVTLAVEDNGKGIGGPPDGRSLHFGILGMQERAREMKGRLKLDSTPGAGTRISVVVPAKR
jgi:signal transduction histidine kinase